jgi:uncharacterized membrane protein YbaN (DUF454 family)
MLRQTRIFLWRLAALIALAIGIIGIVVPVLPTAPFVIVAAWAAGKGWPVLEQRLLEHPTFGPHIRAWREHGAVPRKAKIFATLAMAASAIGLQWMPVAIGIRIAAVAIMSIVAVWLWRRPER